MSPIACRFLFNEAARVRVCLILCALTFLSIGFSAVFLVGIRWLSSSLGTYTSLVDGYNGDYLVTVLTWLSSISILLSVLGCYMSYVQMYPERRSQLQVKMLMMTLAQLCLVVAFGSCSVMCYIYADHVDDSFKGGLSMSMRRYRDNIEVKQKMDHLQSEFECCGDNKYTDWFRVSWVADEFVDIADPDIRDRIHSGSGYQSDDVPFSCCDRAARRPCITQFIHDNKKHFNYDYQKGLTVHVDGCRPALMNYVRSRLFLVLCLITSVGFLLQTSILILYRYLQTSIALAIKKGDPTADSLAYILSICLPTDDMTEDKCLRPVSMAPSVAPSFASSKLPGTMPPPSTSQTLDQPAAHLTTYNVSQSNVMADDGLAAACRRLPTAAGPTPINNSARVDCDQPSSPPSNRSSVISMSAPRGYRLLTPRNI